ncbi:hypothetical protein OKW37_001884 [Paraburkholderia sp. MM5482-R2]
MLIGSFRRMTATGRTETVEAAALLAAHDFYDANALRMTDSIAVACSGVMPPSVGHL